MQHWQYAAVIVGVFLSMTMLLGFVGRVLHRLYNVAKKVEEALGVDEQGKTMRQNVGDLKSDVAQLRAVVIGDDGASIRDDVKELQAAVGNGIRADIRRALDLAGQAATCSARAETSANDARRATNRLTAEMTVIADSVIDDRARVWKALSVLGVDRRQAAIED